MHCCLDGISVCHCNCESWAIGPLCFFVREKRARDTEERERERKGESVRCSLLIGNISLLLRQHGRLPACLAGWLLKYSWWKYWLRREKEWRVHYNWRNEWPGWMSRRSKRRMKEAKKRKIMKKITRVNCTIDSFTLTEGSRATLPLIDVHKQ